MFFKKIICQKCKKKLSKKEFASFSNENICISCYLKEEEKRKTEESNVNWQYIENNCRTLFTLHCDAYVSTTSVGFDISKKKPCIIRSHAFGPLDSKLYWSYSHIEFDELQDLAKKVSEEVFEKYKDLDENNWHQYIKQLELRNNRRVTLYTGKPRRYGFKSITLKFCPQPLGSQSWWELSWDGVLENEYGRGVIAITDDFMKNCSAFELYQHVKQRLNTNTEIPPFYDNEQVIAFLKDIQT